MKSWRNGTTKEGDRLTITWLARQSDELSEPTLRACKAGDRCLSEHAARKVAENVHGLNKSALEQFLVKTREGRKVAKREPGLAKRLAAPDASLSVEGLPSLPFSNGEDQFVDQFLDRYFRLSGVEKKPLPESPGLADRAARLLKHESDIAVNLFCTLPRLKLLDFLLFPIRLSISAVMPARFLDRCAEVQNRLLGKTLKSSIRLKLVVTHGEVGHQHATTVCPVTRMLKWWCSRTWNLEDFSKGLTDLDGQYKDPDGVVPVLFCDEVISLLVLRNLNEKQLGDRYVLVFPLTTKLNIRRFDGRRETPEYRLGLAIDRENKELKEYLSESLQFYLLTDPEYLARLYANLFSDLLSYVADAISVQESRALNQYPSGPAAESRALGEESQAWWRLFATAWPGTLRATLFASTARKSSATGTDFFPGSILCAGPIRSSVPSRRATVNVSGNTWKTSFVKGSARISISEQYT